MTVPAFRLFLSFLLLIIFCPLLPAQTRTVGLLQYDSTHSVVGYTLFAPIRSRHTYLVDNCGKLVNQWTSDYKPALMAYLLDDGSLFRCGLDEFQPTFRTAGGVGGHLEIIDWDGTVLWDYLLSDPYQCQHHDAIMLPNGNVLALVWEHHTAADAIAHGRDPALISDGELWGEKLVELRPIFPDSAEVVWQWRIWDHLVQDFDPGRNNYGVVGDHPELLDLNYDEYGTGEKDWLHCNGLAYHPVEDQIVFSSRNTSEIYIIDHSTSTGEAAAHAGGRSGKGGDFLWRWGNPQVYRRGTVADQRFYWQHNPNWIKPGRQNEGKILVFNNGTFRPGNDYSSVDMLAPVPDSTGNYPLSAGGTFAPDSLDWQYLSPNPPDFHSPFISGAQGLPNGNVLIADGNHGTIFEVDTSGQIHWKYVNPDIGNYVITQGDSIPGSGTTDQWVNAVFRALRYLPDHPGLAGRNLSPGPTVEPDPNPLPCFLLSSQPPAALPQLQAYPNPAGSVLYLELPQRRTIPFRVTDLWGREKFRGNLRNGRGEIRVRNWQPGWYLLRAEGFASVKVLVMR